MTRLQVVVTGPQLYLGGQGNLSGLLMDELLAVEVLVSRGIHLTWTSSP